MHLRTKDGLFAFGCNVDRFLFSIQISLVTITR